VLARGVHASDARVCYSWRQQSLDLEKRGPVRPRASVALTHLSQDQKSVRRGSKEGRLADVLVFFFLELVIGRSVEPSSFLFVLSNVAILLSATHA